MKLEKKDIPANEGLKAIFPALFAKPMNYLELKEDASGESLASSKPLKVRIVNVVQTYRLLLFSVEDRLLEDTM